MPKKPVVKSNPDEEEDTKPILPETPTKKTPSKRKSANPDESPSKKKIRNDRPDYPPITPETCSPPLTGARDARVMIAFLEKMVDTCGAEERKAFAESFGLDAKQFNQAWADSIKFKIKKMARDSLPA